MSKVQIVHRGSKGDQLTAPAVKSSADGLPTLFFHKSSTSDILCLELSVDDEVKESEPQVWNKTEGQPVGLAWDQQDEGSLYIADLAHKSILTFTPEGRLKAIVKKYEKRAFKGPNSIAFGSDGTMFFTDSGALGETSLESPKGSVFAIEGGLDGQLLRPLAYETLAHPSGIACSGNAVYVCETLRNRLLRFARLPSGVWISSVFYQFSGMLGPVGVACGDGRVYVARADVPGGVSTGSVVALSPAGRVISEYELPTADISGITVSFDGSLIVSSDRAIYQLDP